MASVILVPKTPPTTTTITKKEEKIINTPSEKNRHGHMHLLKCQMFLAGTEFICHRNFHSEIIVCLEQFCENYSKITPQNRANIVYFSLCIIMCCFGVSAVAFADFMIAYRRMEAENQLSHVAVEKRARTSSTEHRCHTLALTPRELSHHR